MIHAVPIERLVNLLDPTANVLLNMSVEEAVERVGSGNPERIREIDGQFAARAPRWKADSHGAVARKAAALFHRQKGCRSNSDYRRSHRFNP